LGNTFIIYLCKGLIYLSSGFVVKGFNPVKIFRMSQEKYHSFSRYIFPEYTVDYFNTRAQQQFIG
jgi:hypothetical protein